MVQIMVLSRSSAAPTGGSGKFGIWSVKSCSSFVCSLFLKMQTQNKVVSEVYSMKLPHGSPTSASPGVAADQ